MIPDFIKKVPAEKLGGWIPEDMDTVIRFMVTFQNQGKGLSQAQFEQLVAESWNGGVKGWIEDGCWICRIPKYGFHHVGPDCFSKATAVFLNVLKVNTVPPDVDRIFKRMRIAQTGRGVWTYNGRPASFKREETASESDGELVDCSMPDRDEPQPAPSPAPVAKARPTPKAERIAIPDVDQDVVIDALASSAKAAAKAADRMLAGN